MADLRPESILRVTKALRHLPGIGSRTASSMVDHLLRVHPSEVEELAESLKELHSKIHHCSKCFLLTEEDLCPVCSDPMRDRGLILVLESPTTAWAVEETHEYRGLYHALLGHLSPLHGVGPEDLTIKALVERVETENPREIILGTDPTVEGETTALYIARLLEGKDLKISRPASGIPVGGELAAVDRLTLAQALERRREV